MPEVVAGIPVRAQIPEVIPSGVLYGNDSIPYLAEPEHVGESLIQCNRDMGAVQ